MSVPVPSEDSGTHLRASTWADIQCCSVCEVKPQWKPSRTGGYEQPRIHLSCACASPSQAPNFDFQGRAGSLCLVNAQLASADHRIYWQRLPWRCLAYILKCTHSCHLLQMKLEVAGKSWILCCLHCLMLWVTFPLACSWWQQCLNTVKFCFEQLSCPGLPQHPFPCGTRSPGTAPLHRDCGCWRLPVLAGVPLPMPLSSTLIRNVHNSVLVISRCCLRPNYTVCSGLSKAAHLLCEKQFRNLGLPSAGVLLLWSGKIRVMAGSAQHDSCLRSGCRCQQRSRMGSCCANLAGELHIPQCSPETATIPHWALGARHVRDSCIPSCFLSSPLFFQLHFLLALKHLLLVVTTATFYFFKNNWYSHDPGKNTLFIGHRSVFSMEIIVCSITSYFKSNEKCRKSCSEMKLTLVTMTVSQHCIYQCSIKHVEAWS